MEPRWELGMVLDGEKRLKFVRGGVAGDMGGVGGCRSFVPAGTPINSDTRFTRLGEGSNGTMARKVHGHMSLGWADSPAGSAWRQPRPLCLLEMGVAIAPSCDFALKPNALLVQSPKAKKAREATRYQALGSCQQAIHFFTFSLFICSKGTTSLDSQSIAPPA